MNKVAIIDYGINNINSVRNAFEAVGAEVQIAHDPESLGACDRIVLPGVGSFPEGMTRLRKAGLDDAIREKSRAGIPILGLCLGMQLLAKTGEEFGDTDGLNLIDGRVVKLNVSESRLRLPHVGWNDVRFRADSRLSGELGDSATFYFIHSYSYQDANATYVTGVCDYGGPVVALIEKDNIFGAQFHPEKSQKAGLRLLSNFLKC